MDSNKFGSEMTLGPKIRKSNSSKAAKLSASFPNLSEVSAKGESRLESGDILVEEEKESPRGILGSTLEYEIKKIRPETIFATKKS